MSPPRPRDAATTSESRTVPLAITSATSFLGFISDGAAFTSLTITRTEGPGNFPTADDLIVGTATVTAVPEASSLAMAGLVALAGLGYGWRRKRAAG